MSKRHDIRPRRTSTRGLRAWLLLVTLIFCGSASAQVSPNYQGLWWAAPAGVESGWGINFTHQGDQVFATWYTYDTSGKTFWVSMLAARTSAGNVYAGKISVDHGPPFNNFVGAGVPTEVGSGTLTFADASNGSFSYTMNGVMQTKAITRFDLGDGAQPACVYSAATPNLAAATNYQDLWWVADGAESGWGINFAQQGDRVYATWYTYDLDGTPLWLSVLAPRQGASNVYTGMLYRTSGPRFDQYDPAQIQKLAVGPATFTFTDGNHATFEYLVMYAPLPGPVHQAKQITRFPFAATGGTICQTIPDPQYRASTPTPFAPGCEGTPVNGTLYANAEVEPYVAANPVNPSNLIGVWQQDRWSNGGAKGNLAGASFDGGRTWTRSMAAFSRCTGGNAGNGGDFERASDPWVAIGGDGVAYQIAIAFNGATFAAESTNAVLASRSVDGGRTWGAPVTLIMDGASNFNDKESIVADPFVGGNAYAVWDRLAVSGDAPTYFTRTTDGGVTWEVAHAIFDPGGTNQTINNQTVVLTDGTLVTFFTRLDIFGSGAASATLAVIRSTDKGVTWSAPSTVSGVQAIGARDPETGTPVRDGENLGAIAAGPGGTLVAVWQDSRFSGGVRDGIALSRSIDGGLTWSVPVQVNRDPTVAAFEPAVTIRSDGTIGVTYFDFRSNTADVATLYTDYWLARSSDGVTWRESRVAGPFDLANAPNAEGLFLGDYQALTSIGAEFVPFYVAANTGDTANRTDILASLVTSAGTAAKASAGGAPMDMQASESYRAVTAPPLPATPELARSLTESVMRTMVRRVPGWLPPGLTRPPEH